MANENEPSYPNPETPLLNQETGDFLDYNNLPPGTLVFSLHPDGRQPHGEMIIIRKALKEEVNHDKTWYIVCHQEKAAEVAQLSFEDARPYLVKGIYLFPKTITDSERSFVDIQNLYTERLRQADEM